MFFLEHQYSHENLGKLARKYNKTFFCKKRFKITNKLLVFFTGLRLRYVPKVIKHLILKLRFKV